jgi:hypothetical protein
LTGATPALGPPVVGLVAVDNVRAVQEAPPPAPTAELAVSAHVDTQPPKAGKPTKSGIKPPVAPSHPPVDPPHPPTTPEPPPTAHSGDLFEKRH